MANVTSKQQQLLDDLDEARIVLRIYRRGILLATLAAVMFLLMILAGAAVGMWSTALKVDFGGQAALLIILGIIGTPASTAMGLLWFVRHDYKLSPAARLRKAERDYRNHMLEQT